MGKGELKQKFVEHKIEPNLVNRDRVILPGEAKGISRVRKLQVTVKRLKKEARSLNDSSNYSQQKSEDKKEKFASLDLWGEGGRSIFYFIYNEILN